MICDYHSSEPRKTMEEIKTSVLVVSQLFFTVFGSLVNIFLFIIFRDLPDLSSSTYNVLILNLSFCNIIRCTIIKPMASIFVSYAYTQVLYNNKSLISCFQIVDM